MMGIETMKNVSPKTVDRSTLVQRSSVRLDPAAPREDRLREFIKQIRNPYCYLDGKTVVRSASPRRTRRWKSVWNTI